MSAPLDRTLEPPEDIFKGDVRPNLSARQSLRELLTYMGPALMVSIAYMDPGNHGTDLAAGAGFK
jgi:Mn2+/Fe2+ NRAMP family transporter